MNKLSELTLGELQKLNFNVTLEIMKRIWWIYAIIIVMGVIGFILYYKDKK